MLRNISRELSTLLAAKKIISIENVDAYAYGLELFLFKSVFYESSLQSVGRREGLTAGEIDCEVSATEKDG